jgi:hypothetical protein
VIAATSGLTAAALLGWRRSAKIGAVGFAGFLAWMAGVNGFTLTWLCVPAWCVWLGLSL